MPESGVPIACTLAPDQVEGRLAEFHALFAAHLVRVERPAPTRLRLVLGGAAGEHAVRELLTRERQCCGFIEFTVGGEGGHLLADLEVPAAGAPALDGLSGIAWRRPGGDTVTEGLRTGQLAERAGVNVQTLRYYERRGLLARPPRRPSGQRAYPAETVRLVRTIKAAQQLGFTLTEIVELLQLTAHHRGGGLRARAAAKLAEVERRLADLEVVRSALQTVLASNCDSLTNCSCELRPLFLDDRA